MKCSVAQRELTCADCPAPIRRGDPYVTLLEQDRKVQLHATCAKKRTPPPGQSK